VVQCRLRDPQAKGLVERANGYLEISFLQGRTFESPVDFNDQLQAWLVTTNRAPAPPARLPPGRPARRGPGRDAHPAPVVPVVGWRVSLRLTRNHYVWVASNDYSVAPSALGRRVEVAADLETVTITCEGREVGSHARCWAALQTITDLAHAPTSPTPRPRNSCAAST
jgi:transposase